MSPELRQAIRELENCLELADGKQQDKNAFYLEPTLAIMDYCRTIVKLAKLEADDAGA